MPETPTRLVRLPDELGRAVDAKLDGENFSALVRKLLARWVGKPRLAKLARGRPKAE